MKNKQKTRRSCALISAVLLCILAILPVLFVPASAETADTVPEDYIYIQWDYDLYSDRSLYYTDLAFDRSWSVNTPFYLETYYDEALSVKSFSGTLTLSLEFSSDHGELNLGNQNFVYFGFGSDAPDIDCSGFGGGEEVDFLRLYVPASVLDQIRIFAVASGGKIVVPDASGCYQNGYDAGKAAGEAAHADDYKNGFADGQTDAMNSTSSLKDLIFSIFSAPADLINGILDFDLFGINLASLVKTLITLAVTALIVVFLIKLMRR